MATKTKVKNGDGAPTLLLKNFKFSISLHILCVSSGSTESKDSLHNACSFHIQSSLHLKETIIFLPEQTS